MRIGIDGSCWANRRGFGRFTRCLVAEMARRRGAAELVLVCVRPTVEAAAAGRAEPLPEGVELVVADVTEPPARAASAAGRRRLADIWRMAAAARRARAHVFFFPASYSYFPVVGPPVVVTVHDVTAERLPNLVFATRRARALWAAKRRVALAQARAVVTVSEASRRALEAELGLGADRVLVVREAPAACFRPEAARRRREVLRRLGCDPEAPYLLYAGGISPHKNLEALVRAFELLAGRAPEARLLVVGDLDGDPFLSASAALRERVRSSPAAGRILLAGFVPDEDLAALYAGAVATALPSLGEGFGLTAAESAACGTPVVASRDPALEELLGDAGIWVEARDPAALADALGTLLGSPAARARAARAVRRRAAGWSWTPAADAVLGLLEDVALASRGARAHVGGAP